MPKLNPGVCYCIPLGGKDANWHLLAVQWTGTDVYFDFSHILFGGYGAFQWIKTCLWQYFKELLGRELFVPDLKKPGETPAADEYVFPDYDYAENKEKRLLSTFRPGYVPAEEISQAMQQPEEGTPCRFVFQIPQASLMEYARTHDGSPNAVWSSVVFKALSRVMTDRTEPISGSIVQNCMAEAGCPGTLCDLTRSIVVSYPDRLSDAPISHLSTITRGAIIAGGDEDCAAYDLSYMLRRHEQIDSRPTLEEKIRCAAELVILPGKYPSTFMVSYTGKQDYGEMTEYLTGTEIIIGGHLSFEIITLGDMFIITMMQLTKNRKYAEAILAVLEEEGIPCAFSGPFENIKPGLDVKLV